MDTRRLDLGLVAGLAVESFGEPGQRTFRILAEIPEGRVSLWLEKEQVVMLGAAIRELLERVPAAHGREPSQAAGQTFVGDLEVKAGSLTLGFDAGDDGFRLEATDFITSLPIDTIALLASREQLEESEAEIEGIVVGSRPRCVLCGRPLTAEPHFCPESNGHAELG